jgi:hypothetical protein
MITNFVGVTPCGLVEVCSHFRRMYSLYLEGERGPRTDI